MSSSTHQIQHHLTGLATTSGAITPIRRMAKQNALFILTFFRANPPRGHNWTFPVEPYTGTAVVSGHDALDGGMSLLGSLAAVSILQQS